MAITLGSEMSLSLMHLDAAQTYAVLEDALIDAGFTNFTINRTNNADGSADVQFVIRDYQAVLQAGETLQKLTDAINALEEVESPPE